MARHPSSPRTLSSRGGRPRTRGSEALVAAGRRLRAAREAARLKQAEVARYLHQSAISRQEAGRQAVRADHWVQYAALYGVEAAWLMSGEGLISADPARAGAVAARLEALRTGARPRVRRLGPPPVDPASSTFAAAVAELRPRTIHRARPTYRRPDDHVHAYFRREAETAHARRHLSRLIERCDTSAVDEWLMWHPVLLEMPGFAEGDEVHDGISWRRLTHAEVAAGAEGLTPLGEAVLRSQRALNDRDSERVARHLVERTPAADPLGLQMVGRSRGAPAVTPWTLALEVGVSPTLFTALLDAAVVPRDGDTDAMDLSPALVLACRGKAALQQVLERTGEPRRRFAYRASATGRPSLPVPRPIYE